MSSHGLKRDWHALFGGSTSSVASPHLASHRAFGAFLLGPPSMTFTTKWRCNLDERFFTVESFLTGCFELFKSKVEVEEANPCQAQSQMTGSHHS